jgi:CheY-like chemotaxis protein
MVLSLCFASSACGCRVRQTFGQAPGNYVPDKQNLVLEKLLAGLCAEYQQPAALKGLVRRQQLAPVRVLGDSVAIGRIARNLIDNAIKYTEQGEVRVATGCEIQGSTAVAILSVTDTGTGAGLGLAIVQRLCELTGATISVESELGRGTCFQLTMPAILAAESSPEPATNGAAGVSLRGKRTYVIDDEADILHSMRALLGVWGIESLTADCAAAADRVFEQHGPPDLLIVDLRLGEDVQGAHLAERLQQTHGNFPILIITGETSSEALRQANERNYTVQRKPIAAEVLRRAIASAVAA